MLVRQDHHSALLALRDLLVVEEEDVKPAHLVLIPAPLGLVLALNVQLVVLVYKERNHVPFAHQALIHQLLAL